MTASPLSDREREFLSDIVHFSGMAVEWCSEHETAAHLGANAKDMAAIERMVAIVSEACLRIERGRLEPGRFAELFPDSDIAEVRGMGNFLRHDYGRVDVRVVFKTVRSDLPALSERASQLLEAPD